MTPGFKLHTGNFQPKETYGKKVLCRLFDSDRIVCYPANDINWLTEGPKAPSQHGRIIEYKVVE